MGTISTRVPEELESELEAYLEAEKLDRSTAVRKFLAEGLAEWKRDRALRLFEEGDATLARAAEMADTDVWEFADFAEDRGVAWVDEERAAADLEEL